MKLLATLLLASTFAISAQAATCVCTGTFQNPEWGQLSGTASATCPAGDGSTTYSCGGHMYPANITATCSSHQTGQNNSSSTYVNGQPDSPYPSCYLQ